MQFYRFFFFFYIHTQKRSDHFKMALLSKNDIRKLEDLEDIKLIPLINRQLFHSPGSTAANIND